MADRWMWHVGRSFTDTRLEDSCPCPKAPCGLVISDQIVPDCPEHPWQRGKTMRQGHVPEDCPGAAPTDGPLHLPASKDQPRSLTGHPRNVP